MFFLKPKTAQLEALLYSFWTKFGISVQSAGVGIHHHTETGGGAFGPNCLEGYTRILLRFFSRFILGLCHPWHITYQARTEDSRTLCGNIVSIKLFFSLVLLSKPNPQKMSTSGGDVPTLPGKSTDLVLRPRREDGTQISSLPLETS